MSQSTKFIPFAKPDLSLEEEQAVLKVLRSGWLTTGQETALFEKEMALFLGVTSALGVNSATSGLHLALLALGVGPGDYGIVPSYTYVASAHTLLYTGATLALADSLPHSYHMDPQALEKIIQKEGRSPKVVVLVHLGGKAQDMEPIWQLQKKYGFAILEDAAHSFPGTYKGQYQGTLGDIGVFSFYANKNLTTGEGGMVVTQKEDLAKKVFHLRSSGIDRNAFDRFTKASENWDYQVCHLGYKYNLPDILSAIGRVQLARIGKLQKQREQIVLWYGKELEGVENILLPPFEPESSHHLFQIQLQKDNFSLRQKLKTHLETQGIGTSVHYRPLHTMPYYQKNFGYVDQDFPMALSHFNRTLSLPLYPGLKEEEVKKIAQHIKDFFVPGQKGGH